MPFSSGVADFIQAAVRLPHDRLLEIRSHWDDVQSERGYLAHMVQSSRPLRREMDQLRSYIVASAGQAVAESRRNSPLIDEEVAEIIFPAAESVYIRETLEYSTDSARVTAFKVLTRPFEDLLLPTTQQP
jgi:hypothetical protein